MKTTNIAATAALTIVPSIALVAEEASSASDVASEAAQAIPQVIQAYESGGWQAAAVVAVGVIAGIAFRLWVVPYLDSKKKANEKIAENAQINSDMTAQQKLNHLIDVRLRPFLMDQLRHLAVNRLPLEIVKLTRLATTGKLSEYDYSALLRKIRLDLVQVTREKFPANEFKDITDAILDDLIERAFSKFDFPGHNLVEELLKEQGTEFALNYLLKKFRQTLGDSVTDPEDDESDTPS